jgi:catechol 2,3-dioxygenase-like lactoylglutathione lyase family enzyme
MTTVKHIDHVAITVTDVARSVRWYEETLGLERRHADVWGDTPSMVCAGDTCVAIFPASTPNPAPPPGSDTIAMRHFAFAVDGETFEAFQVAFKESGVEFEFADHDITHSIYIADPDGHRIELTTYDI